MNFFLFISFIVMVAGFGAFFKQEFNLPIYCGAIIICSLLMFTFSKSILGIIKVNSFLIPIIIFLILFLGLKINISSFNINNLVVFSNKTWQLSSILYACYNSITLIPIIINLSTFVKNKTQIKYIAILSFIAMCVLSIIIYIVICIDIVELQFIDIPIIFIANKFGVFYKYSYELILLISIYTTAGSAGFSFLNNISKNKKQYFIYSLIMCAISTFCCNFGFSNLLNFLYPILGVLGIFQVILLIIRFVSKRLL